MGIIYLDEAATTKPKQEVIDAMMPYLTDKWYNPSSLYNPSVNIHGDIRKARSAIGDFIGARSDEIFFTSSGSESNCWAIQGFINYYRRKGQSCSIITSMIEHKSIMSCVDNMDVDVRYIGVDKYGYIDCLTLDNVLGYASKSNDKILVSLQFANNEIGTIQNINKISEIVHKYNAVFHTDAVQAFGHVAIDVDKMGIDMLSASGHKIHAPKGIGILYKNRNVQIDPLIYGSQMDGMRGGTENVAYIIGMAKAVEICKKNMTEDTTNVLAIREYIMKQLKKKFNCKINGSLMDRLANNISVTFKDVIAESLMYLLETSSDMIMVSAGSACNSHSIEPSHVLKAIGLTDAEAMKTIRFSLPNDISKESVDKVICELGKCITLIKTEYEVSE